MKRFTLFLALVAFIGLANLDAQTREISGTVTSVSDGQPIPGVSVIVKGTTIGTTTDVDGQYSLTVPEDASALIFSFVGMATADIPISDRTSIDVTLEPDVLGLDEVVVTALGISRERKALGYAIQEVDEEALNGSIQRDALGALSGKVSGVQIASSTKMGGSSRILIRGANSITGNNEPLIIVDGVPLDNSNFSDAGAATGGGGYDLGNLLNDLNPDNIENISVLKGPAAAIYGSRASNGVIIITTKRAKMGAESFGVEISSNFGFEQVYVIPPLQTKYGGGAIIGDADGGVNGFQQVNVGGQNYLVPQYRVDESWGPRYDPNISVLHWDAWDEESFPDQYLTPRPWVAPENDVIDFYELGTSWVNNIALTKAGTDYGVRFSYTNTSINGTMPGSSQNQNNFSLNGDAKIGKNIDVDATLNYVNQYTKGRPQVGYGDNSVGQKFFQWGQRQLDYELLKDYKNDDGTQRTWNRQAYNNPSPQYSDNPYWTAYENYPDDERNRLYGNVSLSYEILDNLDIRGSVYGDTYNMYNRTRVAMGGQAQSEYYEAVRSNSEFNYEAILTFQEQLSENFGLTALAGANRRVTQYDFNRGVTSGGLIVPGIYNLRNSVDLALTNDFTTEKMVNSVFGSVSLDFSGMLFLEGTIRNDWSTALPEDNNDYYYPGVSASFLFSEVLPNLTWMDLGKVRVGWSQVGNDTDPYRVRTIYNYNASGPFGGTPRLFIDTDLNNPLLRSETTTSLEAGVDLALFNNRISLSATYFDNSTTDHIVPLDVSKATGYDSKFVNAGEMTNKGVELSLGLVPVFQNNFIWEFQVNYTKINNELVELIDGVQSLDLARAPFGGVFIRASEGDTYGQLWGHDFVYDDAGNKVVGANGYYLQTPNLVPLGSVLPDFTMGISNTFTFFKSISLSFLFDIQQGGKFYSLSHMWGMYSGMLDETAGVNDLGNEIRDPVSEGGGIKLDAVTGDVTFNNDGTYTVTNTAPNETYVSGIGWSARHYHGFGFPSAQSVFDADYIKLRELTIGYNLPSSIIGPLKTVRVGLYGRNLLTFGLAKEGFDPEMTVNGSGNVQGLDGGLYPTSRTFGINVKLGF